MQRTKIVFAVTEIGDNAAAGDYFTALELGEQLSSKFNWSIEYREQGKAWYDLEGIDILIAMTSDFDTRKIRHGASEVFKVSWARNWFDAWCNSECIRDYDLHLCSSTAASRYMSTRIGRLVKVLRIAANPARFNPSERPANPPFDFVFTGSYWGVERDIVAAISNLPAEITGAIYGKNWDLVPAVSKWYCGFTPYCALHEVYKKALIVIDDANHTTKNFGATNSRVFDAIAAGCLVITNSPTVSQEVFNGLLPVYLTPKDLENQIKIFQKENILRNNLIQELRSIVMKNHCYRHRAFEFNLHLSSKMH